MDSYDFTLNPYSGCSFGRTYCYAAFFSRDVAKRDNWGHWVEPKENAVELLEKRRPGSLDGKLV
jgi:DNA repair photolyase